MRKSQTRISEKAETRTLAPATDQSEVKRQSVDAIAFYRRFGATEIGRDTENLCVELTRDSFTSNRDRYMKIVEGTT